jgi:hypothetical protein
MASRRTIFVTLLSSFAAVSMAACGGGDSESSSAATTSSLTEEAVPNEADCAIPAFAVDNAEFCASALPAEPTLVPEGSVTTENGSFILYPDGLRGEIQAVTRRPNDEQHPDTTHPDADTMVTVTMLLSNTGTETVPLNGQGSPTLYYGENRYEATGWMTTGDASELPQQLVAGTSATFTTDYTLPAAGVETLALEFSPDRSKYTTYTFTDVETLIQ